MKFMLTEQTPIVPRLVVPRAFFRIAALIEAGGRAAPRWTPLVKDYRFCA
ncbi:MAG TPA: hypothetical protein VNQ31_03470 [Sphingomonadaceae bacterium]|jgi:hypothetical protein|nr:hypothetical protein [Sphingomonadaceae bacterium]